MRQSLQDFYSEDPRRRSGEVRFGLGWRSKGYEFFEFSLFWISGSEELCALRAPIRDVEPHGPFKRPFLAPVPLYSELQRVRPEEMSVEVLVELDEAQVREVLDGWEAHVSDADGFDWVRQRLPGHAVSD